MWRVVVVVCSRQLSWILFFCKLPKLKLNLGLEIFGKIQVNMEENSSVWGSVLISVWPKPRLVSESLLGRQFFWSSSSPGDDVMLFTIPYNSSGSILKANWKKKIDKEIKSLILHPLLDFRSTFNCRSHLSTTMYQILHLVLDFRSTSCKKKIQFLNIVLYYRVESCNYNSQLRVELNCRIWKILGPSSCLLLAQNFYNLLLFTIYY